MPQRPPDSWPKWRRTLYEIIFEAETPAGKAFDVSLIVAILLSVVVVSLDTVEPVHARWSRLLLGLEWGFTLLFSAEYILRLVTAPRPLGYARSFFGVVDLLAVLPTYFGLLFPPGRYLVVVRALRVLRIFRILKLMEYVGEAAVLGRALRASRYKITVFVFAVLTLVLIIGAMMYLVEGPAHGFTSIPRGAYWGIVTLTTVGYGDIAPQTTLGQALASVVMIMGYGIIAVPTGIVTVELGRAAGAGAVCRECGATDHGQDARFCRRCGARVEPTSR
jgi:voltage-gated potassium channel